MTVTKPLNPKPFSVLITDDDRGSREAVREIVEPHGFRTYLAESGEEAFEIVRVEMIHLVILDMHMPRMTGLEALQLFRQLNDVLPAILMTADANQDVMRQAFLARVFSVVPKPVNKHVFLHTLTRALGEAYGPAAGSESGSPPPKE
jgi:two-component system chemotaxis response regulator CheY